MKKIITFCLTFSAFAGFSQNISSNDFENWGPGTIGGTAVENPVGWTTINDAAYAFKALPSVTKTTDKFSGTYAANVKNIQVNYNSKDTVFGGYLFTEVNITGKALPAYLKGKIKYSIAAGEKAMVSFAYKTKRDGIETHYIIGNKSFEGTSSTYIPFTISSQPSYYYERLSDTLVIHISSYNSWKKDAQISTSTNITIDSLGFGGVIPTPIIQAGNNFSNGDFTNWTDQDGLKTPANFYLEGLLQERTPGQIEQSTDSKSGSFALKLGIDPAGLPSVIYTFLKPSTGSKYINGFAKFNLGQDDTAVAYILKYTSAKGFSEEPLDSIIFTGTQSTYKQFSLKFEGKINTGDTIALFFAAFNPAQFENFRLAESAYLLIDDLSVTAFPLGLVNEDAQSNNMIISPNPSSNGIFKVQSAKPQDNLKVFDILGNKVETVVLNSDGSATLDLSKSPRGVYFVSQESGNTKSTFRIVY